MTLSYSTILPQFKKLIKSAQLRTLFNDIKSRFDLLNPDNLNFPAKTGNGDKVIGLNTAATALEYKKVATLDSTTLIDKDLIYYDNASGDFTRLAIGANGTALQVSAGAYTFAALPGGALIVTSIQTTGFTATDGVLYPCDTTGAGFTVVLPPTPTAGQRVAIVDIAGAASSNNIIVDRNGSEIMDLAENMTIDSDYAKVYLVYNATRGWLIL
jgi:hypothetical protein